MDHHDDLTPEQQELVDALIAGTVMRANEATGEAEPMAHDDMPADMRECIRVNRAIKRIPIDGRGVYLKTPESKALWKARAEHRAACPSCLEAEAESMLTDAEWWATEADHDPGPYPDGTRCSPEQCAAALRAEAAELLARAAKIRAERGEG